MRKKMLASVCAALVLIALPAIGAQTARAAITPHFSVSATYNGITYANASAPCGGTVIGVYGSSALQNYAQQAAIDYCAFEQTPAGGSQPAATAPMVVYATGGDSCPGVVQAGSDNNDPIIGVSDVFAPACVVEGFTLGPNAIKDTKGLLQPFSLIAPCPGANLPQGGSIPALSPASPTPCQGGSIDPTVNNLGFCAPGNLSQAQAGLVYAGSIGNWSQVGGCNQTATVDNRISGSGTRVTICFNIFGPGNDGCQQSGAATGPFATTGAMINGICGPSGGPFPGADGNFSIGYAARSGLYKSGNAGNLSVKACGIVAFNGVTGWNGQCDNNNVGTSPGGTHALSPLSGVDTCNGDIQVATSQDEFWGYGHLDTANANTPGNAPAKAFVTWVTTNEPASTIRSAGQMRLCQMGFSRSVDGGALSAQTATC
jgi:hypothetical protein